jgi:DNA-binding transcriptional MocR family regulator
MSLARREDLVRTAREFDALVITDDVYDFLQWPAFESQKTNLEKAVQPRIVDVDRSLEGGTSRDGADGFGNTFSNGSFSKIVGPGVRCGWVEGTEEFAFALSQVYAILPRRARDTSLTWR